MLFSAALSDAGTAGMLGSPLEPVSVDPPSAISALFASAILDALQFSHAIGDGALIPFVRPG